MNNELRRAIAELAFAADSKMGFYMVGGLHQDALNRFADLLGLRTHMTADEIEQRIEDYERRQIVNLAFSGGDDFVTSRAELDSEGIVEIWEKSGTPRFQAAARVIRIADALYFQQTAILVAQKETASPESMFPEFKPIDELEGRALVLKHLVNGLPVCVVTNEGTIAVEGMQFQGTTFVGWRTVKNQSIIPPERVIAILV